MFFGLFNQAQVKMLNLSRDGLQNDNRTFPRMNSLKEKEKKEAMYNGQFILTLICFEMAG